MVDSSSKNEKVRRRRGRGRKGDESSQESPKTDNNAIDNNNINNKELFKAHKSVLIHLTEETPTWHQCGRHTPGRDDTIFSIHKKNNMTTKHVKRNSPEIVAKYRNLADLIYEQEITLFRASSSDSKDDQWVETTMKRGTLKDRIAAMSVVVSTDPVHKLHALDMLLNLAGVNTHNNYGNHRHGNNNNHASQPNARVSQMAAEALADLFTNTLLPNHRKLVSLDARPLFLYEQNQEQQQQQQQQHSKGKNSATTTQTLSPRLLLLWRYEEFLKQKYTAFLSQYLAKTLSDTSPHQASSSPSPITSPATSLDLYKSVALKMASALLRDIPEGEQLVLSMVVNKIGDPSKKIAAAAGHQLRLLLDVHPNMTMVVAREVQQLAHRPHLSSRALYNCIIFLNQLKLIKDEDDDDDGKEEEKTADQNKKSIPPPTSSLPASLIKTYFQLFEVAIKKSQASHSKSKMKTSTTRKNNKAPLPNASSTSAADTAMKSRLLSALLTGVNRAHPYLPKRDASMENHVDALYRIAHISPPAACTQALMLLFHLAVGSGDGDKSITTTEKDNEHNPRKDRFYRTLYAKMADPTMLTSGRQLTLFFNLIYKAMKHDVVSDGKENLRVVAFAKRLMHVCFHYNPAVTSGALFLLSEVMSFQPVLRDAFQMAAGGSDGSDLTIVFDSTKREPRAAFVMNTHVAKDETKEEGGDGESDKDANSGGDGNDDDESIEPMKRGNTQRVKPNGPVSADGTLWEVALTLHHYHPTVSKFSSSVGDISYSGDPLRDFTLAPFLDKFAFRNPKSTARISKRLMRGESVGERRSGIEGGMNALMSLPMNDPEFWRKREENKVTNDGNDFFRTFFAERAKRDELKGIVRKSSTNVSTDGTDGSDDEGEALDAAEGKEVDLDWDTDPEEEEFVQNLAEKLMEGSGHGTVNLDDEDPDMEGWSDSDDDDDDGDSYVDDENDNKIDYSVMDGIGDDDDGDDNDDSDNVDDNDPFQERGEEDEDSDDEHGLEKSLIMDEISEDEEGEDEMENFENKQTNKTKKKKRPFTASFAEASEYEELIEKSWAERKRTRGADEATNSDVPKEKEASSGKRKTRKTQKKPHKG